MEHPRRLILSLYEPTPSLLVDLGVWDLSAPALQAIEDGTITSWYNGVIPSCWCLSIFTDHKVRMAAWRGSLCYAASPAVIKEFAAQVSGYSDIPSVIRHMEACNAARKLVAEAEVLLDIFDCAPRLKAEPAFAYHPLTRELVSAADARESGVEFTLTHSKPPIRFGSASLNQLQGDPSPPPVQGIHVFIYSSEKSARHWLRSLLQECSALERKLVKMPLL